MSLSRQVNIRLDEMLAIRYEAAAAALGLSLPAYLRKRLEEQDRFLFMDVAQLRDQMNVISHSLVELDERLVNSELLKPIQSQPTDNKRLEAAMLETLLLLRTLANPQKVAEANARLHGLGLESIEFGRREK